MADDTSAWPGFLGPSHFGYSRLAETQQLKNWFTEATDEKGPKALYRTPGLGPFRTPIGDGIGNIRGFFSLNGHLFIVIGVFVMEMLPNSNLIDYSTASGVFVVDDGKPVHFAASPTQLMITSGGRGYVLQMATLAEITDVNFPIGTAIGCEYLDGYFIVIKANSQQFQVSAILDCTVWNALDVSEAESRPDFIAAVLVRGEELWMGGLDTFQVFGAGGGAFPFTVNQNIIVQTGIEAADSLLLVGNTIVWVGKNEEGSRCAYAMDGYSPAEVSEPWLTAEWQKYPAYLDAISSAFQVNGHTFTQIYFPTANKTWRVDMKSGDWHEATYFNPNTGSEEAHRCQIYANVFGKVLGGDRSNANVYVVGMQFLDDNGAMILRQRVAPHLDDQLKMRTFSLFKLDGNVGIGLGDVCPFTWSNTEPDYATFAATLAAAVMAGTITGDQSVIISNAYLNAVCYDVLKSGGVIVDGVAVSGPLFASFGLSASQTPGYDPAFLLRWSDDGGKTWSNYRTVKVGRAGKFKTRIRVRRMGRGIDRVYDMVCTEPVDWMWAACYLEAH